MTRKFQSVVYKITFPNGKIYIGKDIGKDGHSIRYFGSWDASIVEEDFTKSELQDFLIRREIIFESSDKALVGKKEMEMIVGLGANDPERGYNRLPKFKSKKIIGN